MNWEKDFKFDFEYRTFDDKIMKLSESQAYKRLIDEIEKLLLSQRAEVEKIIQDMAFVCSETEDSKMLWVDELLAKINNNPKGEEMMTLKPNKWQKSKDGFVLPLNGSIYMMCTFQPPSIYPASIEYYFRDEKEKWHKRMYYFKNKISKKKSNK